MSAGRREATADWLMVFGGLALVVSLFLPWSHQLPASVLAQYGATAALAGVPRNPDAWQLYSAVDVLLALLAGGLLVAALRGGRVWRGILLVGLLIAVAFTLHALSSPPTNGVNLYDPSLAPPGYTPTSPGAGRGETLALIAIGLGLGGLLLSFTADY
ncbi:MAG: hypothetical protein ACR2NR_15825 [Solirubrobacteraceae bacterium]